MLLINRLIFFILIALPFLAVSQNTLTITVEGVEASKGHIAVAVYSEKEFFLKEGKEFTGIFAKAFKDVTAIEIPNLPNGEYAVCIFHDENDNKKMDTNFFGIPKEPIGFSIGKVKTFGPPGFDECSFVISSDFEIKIPID